MVVKLLAILLLETGRILSNLLRPTKTALEASLIGVEGSSRSWFLPRPWVARFSPRSAPRPPHHGVRRAGVPICVAASRAACRPPAPSSQRDRLARRPHGNDAALPCRAETRSL